MKIIVVGSYRWGIYAPAIAEGFKRMGHNVLQIDYEEYHFNDNSPIAHLFNRIQDRFLIGFPVKRFNHDIIKGVNQFKPDLVFLYRCYHIYDSTLRRIKNQTVIFSYNNDDPFSGVPSKAFCRRHISNSYLCHMNYVYRPKNIEDYAKIGVKNTKVLLPYYLSTQNRYIEGRARDIPIAYLGHWENDGRDFIIKTMIEAGLPVSVYGDISWSQSSYYDYLKPHLFPPQYGDEYNITINRSLIALVFFSKINHDQYTRRCFEIPATKTLMICPYTDAMLSLFPEDTAAMYYRDAYDLIAKCQSLLSNKAKIKEVAEGGYARLKEIGGSELDRVQEVINDWLSLRSGETEE